MKQIVFYIFCFLVLPLSAQVKTKVSVDSTNYLVGDYINYKVEMTVPKNVQIFFPAIKDALKKLELVEQLPLQKKEENGVNTLTYHFVLAGYDSGQATIPSLVIPYKSQTDTALSEITTDSIQLIIHTLPVDTTKEAKDIKDPITIPLNWLVVLAWILGGAVVVVGGYYLYKRFKKQPAATTEEEIVQIPAYETALTALDQLEAKKLWQSGRVKEYHTEVTEIVRSYFEKRFNMPALELTTDETLQLLGSRIDAASVIQVTKEFLQNADMVKFAKFIPLNEINEAMLGQARKIVTDTIPVVNLEKNKEDDHV